MLRVAGPLAEVDDGGVTREVRVAPRLPGGPPVAGDRVTLDDSGTQGIIRGISPRRTVGKNRLKMLWYIKQTGHLRAYRGKNLDSQICQSRFKF